MLKLRYLFGNADLAAMLLRSWEHDRPSAQLFDSFRISANAVYPFLRNGQRCYLRFAPIAEKCRESLEAEISFLSYLRSRGFPAAEPLPTLRGTLALCAETPWGPHCACAFQGVPGKPLDAAPLGAEHVRRLGATLGRLHALSREWPAGAARPTHAGVMDWIQRVLADLGGQERALEELALLREHFAAFPRTPDNYGLIHYDFEPDNVFLDGSTGTMSVIDFDDAMYHWYGMDVEQAIAGVTGSEPGLDAAAATRAFLDGYAEESPVDQAMLEHLPAFTRFASLYGYARVARSVAERWENEPEWMQALRGKLSSVLARRSADFCRPVGLPAAL